MVTPAQHGSNNINIDVNLTCSNRIFAVPYIIKEHQFSFDVWTCVFVCALNEPFKKINVSCVPRYDRKGRTPFLAYNTCDTPLKVNVIDYYCEKFLTEKQ